MAEFHIERLGLRGDGIAEGPVYAQLTLPGETVSGVLEGNSLRNVKIITPSANRVASPCPHFKSCGGCQLQHASDDFVKRWKREVIERALQAQGLTTSIRTMITSPSNSRRRATLSARRTKKAATAGFHSRASDMIVDIPNCILLQPELMAALPLAKALAAIGLSRRGELSVTVTHSLSGLDIAAKGGCTTDRPTIERLAAEAEEADIARLTWNDEVIVARRPPAQRFGHAMVIPPPGAFLQATQHGENALLSAVREIVGEAGSVADLFSGCGTFTLPLANTARIHAVEGSSDMTKALEQGWRSTQGLKQVSTETRDLFRNPLLADEFSPFETCVIDPPRAGAEAQVFELAKAQLPRIAYVSCNPVSFARDARTLVDAGYRLDWIQPIDQFRWSTHVELVASFTHNSA